MKSICLLLVLSVFTSLVFTACNIGLGESVDTSVPSVTIEYPPSGAVICGVFTLAGSCHDDRRVTRLTVHLKNEIYEENYYPVLSLSPNAGNSTWETVIDGTSYKDGKYFITVTVYDEFDQSSVITSNFTIDNTAPMLFFTTPSSGAVATYTNYFDLEGYSSELNSIKSVSLTINCTTDSKSNVLSTSINSNDYYTYCPVARWHSPAGSPLKENYTLLYGSTDVGEKTYEMQVRVTDSARVYNDKTNYYGNETGNSTVCYWYQDEIKSTLESSPYNASEIPDPELLRLIYTDTCESWSSYGGVSIEDIKNVLESTKHDSSSSPLHFKLDPS